MQVTPEIAYMNEEVDRMSRQYSLNIDFDKCFKTSADMLTEEETERLTLVDKKLLSFTIE